MEETSVQRENKQSIKIVTEPVADRSASENYRPFYEEVVRKRAISDEQDLTSGTSLVLSNTSCAKTINFKRFLSPSLKSDCVFLLRIHFPLTGWLKNNSENKNTEIETHFV